MKLRFRTKLFTAAALFGAAVAAAAAVVLYLSLSQLPLSRVTGGLAATVAQAAGQINPNDVVALSAAADPSRDRRYNRVHGVIERVRDNLYAELRGSNRDRGGEMISDYYVIVRTADPEMGRVIVARRRDQVGAFVPIGQSRQMLDAWDGLRVVRHTSEEAGGRALSAYAPIRDMSENAVAIIGMDVSGRFLESDSTTLGFIAVVAFGLAVLLSTALAWMLAHRMNRPVALLDGAVQQVAAGDLDTQLPKLRGGDEFDLLFSHFNQMVEQLREGAQVKRSLALASNVQRYLLPRDMPRIDGFDIAGGVKYCDETGGDYYDVIDLAPHEFDAPGGDKGAVNTGAKWGLAIGDVTGHGISAALLMAWTRAVLRTEAPEYGLNIAGMFRNINRHLMRDAESGKFLTLFYAVLDVPTRRLTWISAGHEPGLLCRASDGKVEQLLASEIPLGIEDRPFRAGEPTTMRPGDVLLISTDGVTQAADGKDYFGVERLADVIKRHADRSAAEIRDAVIDAAARFLNGSPQQDDITLIVLKAL